MSSPFQCGDHEALLAYAYDECEPAARDVITAHLATCAGCAEELAGISAARRLLAAWQPPETALGWQLDTGQRADGNASAAAPWWRQPLPAWAQVAAAVLIFGAGLAAGGRASSAPASEPVDVVADWQPAVAAIENRVAAVESAAADHQALLAGLSSRETDSDALLRQIRSEINASEERVRRQVAVSLVLLKAEENYAQQTLTSDFQQLSSQVQYILRGAQQ